ncbi:MAG: bifunctional DNA-binding transcriptional regulator/O6-methylguanine-DNA methyltransferase Ada [Methylacidiphilales bacterium]|nr:bifunctional DNA-binding transcriptional regulator/O6-methylguanine-DNA methyltransferase Ada [Candidatus Methylacidiphilales bacterium]
MTSVSKSRIFASDEEKWRAVLRRDIDADGKFWFAVKTTGIYCRPSCGAKHPLRRNVIFHYSIAEAEKAGFRACQRCHPHIRFPFEKKMAGMVKACRMLELSDQTPSLDDLAKVAGLSRYHFHRCFKAATGLTPKAYAMAHRSGRVRKELSRRPTVTEAIYGAGFNSNGRFYAKSRQMLGMKPRNFQRGGEGEIIRYVVAKCSLGKVLVAASEKGICAILLGDNAKLLIEDLRHRFCRARLKEGGGGFERSLKKVIQMVETPKRGLNLPLDVRGTAFQQKVWDQLQKIPAGSTVSYREIATWMGQPKAVRAVAQTCGANPIAVAIPCHRVLRSGGAISGYRWGVDRKRKLLQREQAAK